MVGTAIICDREIADNNLEVFVMSPTKTSAEFHFRMEESSDTKDVQTSIEAHEHLQIPTDIGAQRPYFLLDLQDVEILGNSATLKAIVMGDPMPTISWSVDGQSVLPQE